MRREKKKTGYESNPNQLLMSTMIEDLKARKQIVAKEEGIREQYSHAFNPIINEGFFADKVIIVEGPSEEYSLPIYAEIMNYNLNRKNLSVVHSGGKGQMDRLFRVFNGFKIPTYLWFDGDKNHKDANVKEKTLELLNLLEDPITKIEDLTTKVADNYTVLENDFEQLLIKEVPDYEKIIASAGKILGPTGKPLKHRFLANQLKSRVDKGDSPEKTIPPTIFEILKKIKILSYTGSILQKIITQ